MMIQALGLAIVLLGCVTMKRIENNTRLLEEHTRQLLEKAQKFDDIYNKLSGAFST
jgi:hypothetical protein